MSIGRSVRQAGVGSVTGWTDRGWGAVWRWWRGECLLWRLRAWCGVGREDDMGGRKPEGGGEVAAVDDDAGHNNRGRPSRPGRFAMPWRAPVARNHHSGGGRQHDQHEPRDADTDCHAIATVNRLSQRDHRETDKKNVTDGNECRDRDEMRKKNEEGEQRGKGGDGEGGERNQRKQR